MCSATSRLLVHRAIAPAFLARLKQRAEALDVGDPLKPGTRIGPQVLRDQPHLSLPLLLGCCWGSIDQHGAVGCTAAMLAPCRHASSL